MQIFHCTIYKIICCESNDNNFFYDRFLLNNIKDEINIIPKIQEVQVAKLCLLMMFNTWKYNKRNTRVQIWNFWNIARPWTPYNQQYIWSDKHQILKQSSSFYHCNTWFFFKWFITDKITFYKICIPNNNSDSSTKLLCVFCNKNNWWLIS